MDDVDYIGLQSYYDDAWLKMTDNNASFLFSLRRLLGDVEQIDRTTKWRTKLSSSTENQDKSTKTRQQYVIFSRFFFSRFVAIVCVSLDSILGIIKIRPPFSHL